MLMILPFENADHDLHFEYSDWSTHLSHYEIICIFLQTVNACYVAIAVDQGSTSTIVVWTKYHSFYPGLVAVRV